MQELIKEIESVQTKYNLNDGQFAKTLNVDPALICRMKQRTQTPGADFLAALSNKYPELDFAILKYMKGRANGKAT